MKQYAQLLLSTSFHKNVMFLRRVSQDLIPAYYKKADFMVLLRETNRKSMAGFPTKFAESMTVGVPVITNATSDLAKHVINGKTEFLVEGMITRVCFLRYEVLYSLSERRIWRR